MSIELNKQQKNILNASIDKPLLISAGPGSGKTFITVERIKKLYKRTNRHNFLILTFTKAASQNIKEKIKKECNFFRADEDDKYQNIVKTFHSFGYYYAKKYFVRSTGESWKTLKEGVKSKKLKEIVKEEIKTLTNYEPHVLREINQLITGIKLRNYLDFFTTEDSIEGNSKKIEYIQRSLISSLHLKSLGYEEIESTYREFENWKKDNCKIDFEDSLVYCLEYLKKYPENAKKVAEKYDFIFVDEYQDTNRVQFAILCELAKYNKKIFCVGDPNQSIFAFAGGMSDIFSKTENLFKDINSLPLTENYRSTKKIVALAQKFIEDKNYKTITNSKLFTNNEIGADPKFFVAENSEEEINYVIENLNLLIQKDPKIQILILYRNETEGKKIKKLLLKEKQRHLDLKKEKFINNKELQAIVAYAKCCIYSENFNDEKFTQNFEFLTESKKFRVTPTEKKKLLNNELDFSKAIEDNFCTANLKPDTQSRIKLLLKEKEKFKNIKYEDAEELLNIAYESVGYKDEWEEKNNVFQEQNFEKFIVHIVLLKGFYADLNTEQIIKKTLSKFQNSIFDGNEDINIYVSTIHTAKGREFDCVFLCHLVAGILPFETSLEDPDKLIEEANLTYVAITRAKKLLYISGYENEKSKLSNFFTNLESKWNLIKNKFENINYQEEVYLIEEDSSWQNLHFDESNISENCRNEIFSNRNSFSQNSSDSESKIKDSRQAIKNIKKTVNLNLFSNLKISEPIFFVAESYQEEINYLMKDLHSNIEKDPETITLVLYKNEYDRKEIQKNLIDENINFSSLDKNEFLVDNHIWLILAYAKCCVYAENKKYKDLAENLEKLTKSKKFNLDQKEKDKLFKDKTATFELSKNLVWANKLNEKTKLKVENFSKECCVFEKVQYSDIVDLINISCENIGYKEEWDFKGDYVKKRNFQKFLKYVSWLKKNYSQLNMEELLEQILEKSEIFLKDENFVSNVFLLPIDKSIEKKFDSVFFFNLTKNISNSEETINLIDNQKLLSLHLSSVKKFLYFISCKSKYLKPSEFFNQLEEQYYFEKYHDKKSNNFVPKHEEDDELIKIDLNLIEKYYCSEQIIDLSNDFIKDKKFKAFKQEKNLISNKSNENPEFYIGKNFDDELDFLTKNLNFHIEKDNKIQILILYNNDLSLEKIIKKLIDKNIFYTHLSDQNFELNNELNIITAYAKCCIYKNNDNEELSKNLEKLTDSKKFKITQSEKNDLLKHQINFLEAMINFKLVESLSSETILTIQNLWGEYFLFGKIEYKDLLELFNIAYEKTGYKEEWEETNNLFQKENFKKFMLYLSSLQDFYSYLKEEQKVEKIIKDIDKCSYCNVFLSSVANLQSKQFDCVFIPRLIKHKNTFKDSLEDQIDLIKNSHLSYFWIIESKEFLYLTSHENDQITPSDFFIEIKTIWENLKFKYLKNGNNANLTNENIENKYQTFEEYKEKENLFDKNEISLIQEEIVIKPEEEEINKEDLENNQEKIYLNQEKKTFEREKILLKKPPTFRTFPPRQNKSKINNFDESSRYYKTADNNLPVYKPTENKGILSGIAKKIYNVFKKK